MIPLWYEAPYDSYNAYKGREAMDHCLILSRHWFVKITVAEIYFSRGSDQKVGEMQGKGHHSWTIGCVHCIVHIVIIIRFFVIFASCT